jgi:hypothetical protein
MATVYLRAAGAAAVLLLAACAHESQDQMSWARAALERNGQLEIVAADPQSRTFTVRVKDTGELRMVRADQVMAGPVPNAPAAASPATAGAPPAAASAARVADSSTSAPEPATAAADEASAAPESQERSDARSAATAPETRTGGGPVLASGPGYTIQSAAGAKAAVMQSGPGYSVKAASGAAAPSGNARLRDTGITSAVVERRREPIVCQGDRMLHIDNRNMESDGDAVTAEDGCEIHITNSHITATGIGVLARRANVHIENSLIEGDGGSIDASEGAQVYATSTQFRGLSRRLDSAAFHDLGGNIWN